MGKKVSRPDQIAEEAMPGWKAVAISGASPTRSMQREELISPDVEATMPELDFLQLAAPSADAMGKRQYYRTPPEADNLAIVTLQSGNNRINVGVRNGAVVWKQG